MSPSGTETPETEEISPELYQKFCNILQNHGITEEVESMIMTHPPELKGEHMATATVYVTVNFKKNGKKPKNLFVKKFMNSEMFTKASKDMKIMDKEAEFFNKFLPACRNFCKRFEGCEDLLHFFPTCLYADEDMVVLENHVLNDDFIMLPKEELQDLETAKHVLGNLARFHATTFSIVAECGGKDGFISKWGLVAHEALLTESNPFSQGMFDNGLNTCVTILKGVSLPDAEETAGKLCAMMGTTFKKVLTCVATTPEDKLVVVNHGDCWNNNMLFKVDPRDSDGKRRVKEHMFVDLQVTRLTSACMDITYFLYTSVKADVRNNQLLELLRHYYNVLSTTFGRFDQKCPLSFEELVADYQKRAFVGYLSQLNFVCMMGALKELSFEDMGGTTPEEMVEGFNRIMNSWISRNPTAANEISRDIIASVKAYEKLVKMQVIDGESD